MAKAIFQVFNSPVCLGAIVLGNADTDHFHCQIPALDNENHWRFVTWEVKGSDLCFKRHLRVWLRGGKRSQTSHLGMFSVSSGELWWRWRREGGWGGVSHFYYSRWVLMNTQKGRGISAVFRSGTNSFPGLLPSVADGLKVSSLTH